MCRYLEVLRLDLSCGSEQGSPAHETGGAQEERDIGIMAYTFQAVQLNVIFKNQTDSFGSLSVSF
jgi:hypothetical protein